MTVKEIINSCEPVWKPNVMYDTLSPKVTVILPTYRRAKNGRFEAAVESVLNQTYKNWELIIVDDASTDGTENLIKFFMELDLRISTIRHTYNMGLPAISEYEAYVRSRGEYIAFIFDDCVWDPNHLMFSMKAMIKENVKITCCAAKLLDPASGQFIVLPQDMEYLPCQNVIANAAIIIHKEVIETVGFYDPHVTLTRLCDWDLWIRISKRYYIYKISEIFSVEYGATLSDSLGNTVIMNLWVSRERMCMERTSQLQPKNLLQIDIGEICDSNTDMYVEFVEMLYKKYHKKHWYTAYEIKEIKRFPKKRILIIAPGDATYYLEWDFISEKAITLVRTFEYRPIYDYSMADAIVIIRSPIIAAEVLENVKIYKIPVYYYLDDNLWKIDDYKSMMPYLSSESLGKYKGIIASTDNLGKYIAKHNPLSKVSVFPPCVSLYNDKITQRGEILNIAFLGGIWREDVFVSVVFNAVKIISNMKKVRLFCRETLAEKLKSFSPSDNIEILPFATVANYNQLLAKMREKNINILIHCGRKQEKNNKYKNLNALINAVQIGAVLYTSAAEPYIGIPGIVTCENDIEDWSNKLTQFIYDPVQSEKQFNEAYAYVNKHYSVENNNELDGILEKIKSVSIAETVMRYSNIIEKSDTPTEAKQVINNVISHDYTFIDRILSFRTISKRTSYTISPQENFFNKLGLIIASSTAEYGGEYVGEIYDKKKLLATAKIDIGNSKQREVAYFDFGVNLPAGKKLKLKITPNYANVAQNTGVYENKYKKSFIYKVFKKVFNYNLPVTDVLYYEIL